MSARGPWRTHALQWSRVVRTIEAYRGVKARYSFPALGQLRDLFVDADFSVADVLRPGYELGDRCPSLVLEPGSPRGGP